MKIIRESLFILVLCFIFQFQTTYAQNNDMDTLKTIETTGIFDGKLVRVGKFYWERLYQINQYCIAQDDLSQTQVDSLKGKSVLVKGILKVKEGEYGPTKSTDEDGTIYEPYKEPDKLFISKPQFTIIENTKP